MDLEALRAALSADDALVVGKYTLHGTDNGTAHFTYLNDVGKPRGLWTPADALIPAQTILALLAERDRLLAVVEAAGEYRASEMAYVEASESDGQDDQYFTRWTQTQTRMAAAAKALDAALAALKEHADAP